MSKHTTIFAQERIFTDSEEFDIFVQNLALARINHKRILTEVDQTSSTLAVGTVTTGNAGTNATITNVGTPLNAVFNFVIPKGDQGTPAPTVLPLTQFALVTPSNFVTDTVSEYSMQLDTTHTGFTTVNVAGLTYLQMAQPGTYIVVVATHCSNASGVFIRMSFTDFSGASILPDHDQQISGPGDITGVPDVRVWVQMFSVAVPARLQLLAAGNEVTPGGGVVLSDGSIKIKQIN